MNCQTAERRVSKSTIGLGLFAAFACVKKQTKQGKAMAAEYKIGSMTLERYPKGISGA
jgi:hypothetical protein